MAWLLIAALRDLVSFERAAILRWHAGIRPAEDEVAPPDAAETPPRRAAPRLAVISGGRER